MNTSAAAFSKCFRADNPTLWNEFVERFSATPGHVCYYPSAGSDFRPLVYQQITGMEESGLIGKNRTSLDTSDAPEVPGTEYAAPNLWILSDFCAVDPPNWLASGVQHRDAKVEVKTLAITEIHANARHFNMQVNEAYISLPTSNATGRAFFLRLSVRNAVIGEVEVDALYFCYENINLIHQFFLRHQVPISHLVWVRDGAGFGGGRLRHDFLIPLLPLLQTRWLFTSEHYLDTVDNIRWPQELRYYEQLVRRHTTALRQVGILQYGTARVVFSEVANAPLDFVPEKAGVIQRFSRSPNPGHVYLWLHCEEWMKFGPFAWLRFDDLSGAILDPREEAVAWRDDGGWRTSMPRGESMVFSNLTISSSSERPHKNSAFTPRQRTRISIDEWQEFYDGEFQSLLAAVLHQYPDKADCLHCQAPKELRVLLPEWRELQTLVPNSVAERFICCWYGTVLVAQGVHQFIHGYHPAWTLRNFCPLPVRKAGVGCVQVSSPRVLLAANRPSSETWSDFIPFFRKRILGEMEKLTGMSSGEFMTAIRNSIERQAKPIHPLEALLFSSFPSEENHEL